MLSENGIKLRHNATPSYSSLAPGINTGNLPTPPDKRRKAKKIRKSTNATALVSLGILVGFAVFFRHRKLASVPLSLTGQPVFSFAPPDSAQFGAIDYVSVPLLKRYDVSHSSAVFTFALPDTSKGLGLSTCACILAMAETEEEDVVRPYTPISTNVQLGSFDLLVKLYPDGKMTSYMHDMSVGDTLNFKHISFNVKIQAPFPQKHIGMIVGGTGITPMIQALHAILGDKKARNKVTLLYGSKKRSDILGEELLKTWEVLYPNRLKIVHSISHDDEIEGSWDGYRRGYIDTDLIEEMFPPPEEGEDVIIFICGPPPMYDVFSGPRTEKDLKGTLKDLGYSAEQVYKF